MRFPFLFLILLVLTSFSRKKDFPEIHLQTVDGRQIDNSFFSERKTLVVLAHLGCPPAMVLFKDLDSLPPNQIQILLVLENTAEQVRDFNSMGPNVWSGLRNHFRLNPLQGNIVAECETGQIQRSGEKIRIGTQCRKLARKIHTRDSPTLVLVNEKGQITRKMKGYFEGNDRISRLQKWMEL